MPLLGQFYQWLLGNTHGLLKRKLAVPLAQLVPLASDELTQQAIADWPYWRERGYQF